MPPVRDGPGDLEQDVEESAMEQNTTGRLPEARPSQAQSAPKSRKIFYCFLIAIAAVGILFVAVSLLRPHQTGVVTYVGRIGRYTFHSGVGKNAGRRVRYKSDVKVRIRDSSQITTVYYRVKDPADIPELGDEIEFSNHWLVGNQPYPQMGAVWTGIALLGADLLVYAGFLLADRRRPRSKEPTG